MMANAKLVDNVDSIKAELTELSAGVMRNGAAGARGAEGI